MEEQKEREDSRKESIAQIEEQTYLTIFASRRKFFLAEEIAREMISELGRNLEPRVFHAEMQRGNFSIPSRGFRRLDVVIDSPV